MGGGDAAWTRGRLSRVCALADLGAVETVAAVVRAGAAAVATVQEPTRELVLMETADPTTGGSFYLGEVLVTSALIEVDGQVGVGLVVGDEPERARAGALIDAALQAAIPPAALAAALAELEREVEEAHRREWALAARTRVQFETMEDRDPGATRSAL
ncbi:MAG TPA: phosphonate C-P lyase system protein PhnG [Chloroflexota bacterium]